MRRTCTSPTYEMCCGALIASRNRSAGAGDRRGAGAAAPRGALAALLRAIRVLGCEERGRHDVSLAERHGAGERRVIVEVIGGIDRGAAVMGGRCVADRAATHERLRPTGSAIAGAQSTAADVSRPRRGALGGLDRSPDSRCERPREVRVRSRARTARSDSESLASSW